MSRESMRQLPRETSLGTYEIPWDAMGSALGLGFSRELAGSHRNSREQQSETRWVSRDDTRTRGVSLGTRGSKNNTWYLYSRDNTGAHGNSCTHGGTRGHANDLVVSRETTLISYVNSNVLD